MKRFFLAVLFFAILIGLWELAFRAKIWSPVLLPAPQQVAEYLKTTISDGSLLRATVITMTFSICRAEQAGSSSTKII